MAEGPTPHGDAGNADLTLYEAVAELRALHGTAPTYHRLWLGIVNGRVRGHRCGREWRIRRADLPAVADAFGLTSRPAA